MKVKREGKDQKDEGKIIEREANVNTRQRHVDKVKKKKRNEKLV